jgi:tRNA-binding EMAP/Myf-like protein
MIALVGVKGVLQPSDMHDGITSQAMVLAATHPESGKVGVITCRLAHFGILRGLHPVFPVAYERGAAETGGCTLSCIKSVQRTWLCWRWWWPT